MRRLALTIVILVALAAPASSAAFVWDIHYTPRQALSATRASRAIRDMAERQDHPASIHVTRCRKLRRIVFCTLNETGLSTGWTDSGQPGPVIVTASWTAAAYLYHAKVHVFLPGWIIPPFSEPF